MKLLNILVTLCNVHKNFSNLTNRVLIKLVSNQVLALTHCQCLQNLITNCIR
nr:MAG TPA: hypothetical protein [Caudoviricetes sp.]